MKKLIISSLAIALMFSGFGSASAQTSTSSNVTQLQLLIQSLLSQVADLQAKVEAQRRATVEVREAAGDVRDTVKLIRQLSHGMSGDDVLALQAILAADPDVYPEGLVTGFFGQLTASAVKKFQKKHGLEQVGRVGPKTLEKLAKELEKHPLLEEGDDDEDDDEDGGKGKGKGKSKGQGKRLCAIVPPGHLIAPGWLRENDRPVVLQCQTLPPGILKKLGLATSTPDTTAPVLTGVMTTSTASTSVHVVWRTDEKATSKIWYATVSPVVATSTTLMVSSATLTKDHNLTLLGLIASTTYYAVAESSDAAGNKGMSTEISFTTSQ